MSEMIRPGDSLPSLEVRRVSGQGTERVDLLQWLGEGTVVLFSVPGAFTPTCHNDHLPGFVSGARGFSAAGVDRIVCATVNDHYVVQAWAKSSDALAVVDFIADSEAELARKLGLARDLSAGGLGWRFVRSAMIIKDGVVKNLLVDDKPGQLTKTSASAILSVLTDQGVLRSA